MRSEELLPQFNLNNSSDYREMCIRDRYVCLYCALSLVSFRSGFVVQNRTGFRIAGEPGGLLDGSRVLKVFLISAFRLMLFVCCQISV